LCSFAERVARLYPNRRPSRRRFLSSAYANIDDNSREVSRSFIVQATEREREREREEARFATRLPDFSESSKYATRHPSRVFPGIPRERERENEAVLKVKYFAGFPIFLLLFFLFFFSSLFFLLFSFYARGIDAGDFLKVCRSARAVSTVITTLYRHFSLCLPTYPSLFRALNTLTCK